MSLRNLLAAIAAGALAMAASLAFAVDPQPGPFTAGDPKQGENLANRDCISCHAGKYDGDAERIYLRSDRRVKTPAQLLTQIQACNAQLGTGYFPDEEEHVAAYLNLHYYHFRQ